MSDDFFERRDGDYSIRRVRNASRSVIEIQGRNSFGVQHSDRSYKANAEACVDAGDYGFTLKLDLEEAKELVNIINAFIKNI